MDSISVTCDSLSQQICNQWKSLHKKVDYVFTNLLINKAARLFDTLPVSDQYDIECVLN